MKSFCRFTVGRPGTSAANLRYVSRRDAVKEREGGAFFWNVPSEVTVASSYPELRLNLEAYGWAREESEETLHRMRGGSGDPRSHYRCVLSFEGEVTSQAVRMLVEEWARRALPNAVVAGFVHRNTEHVHAHLWIDARGTDGRKLDFSPKAWRDLGKKWDRIYERAMERQALLEGRFRETTKESPGEQGRALRADSRASDGAKESPKEESRLESGEQAARRCASSRERALREIGRLREELARLARGKDRSGKAAEGRPEGGPP